MNEYGGVWIDSTVLLTNNIPENILKNDFFAFHATGIRDHFIENWFLVSKKDNIFISTVKYFLLEYWKNEKNVLTYFFFHLYLDIIIENDKHIKELWEKVPYYCDECCYELNLNLLLKFNENKFKEILNKTHIHKLSYKYDKNLECKNSFLNYIRNY